LGMVSAKMTCIVLMIAKCAPFQGLEFSGIRTGDSLEMAGFARKQYPTRMPSSFSGLGREDI